MKKNKIIGLLVAVGGSIASISTAAALYVNGASGTGFGIGAQWHSLEGTITYKINGETTGTVQPSYLKADGTNGGHGFGGAYTQAHYSFPLGASFSADMPAQNYVLGVFGVSITNINSALVNNAKIWIGVEGYTAGTYGYNEYHNAFMSSDDAITSTEYTKSARLTVGSNKQQSVEIYFKLDNPLTVDLTNAESKLFDISVNWGEDENYVFAHVVGKSTMFEEDDVYAMVPNINASGSNLEWTFNNLPGTMEESKCRKGDTWSADVYNELDPDCKNQKLDSSAKYDVYWSGSSEAQASYQVITE